MSVPVQMRYKEKPFNCTNFTFATVTAVLVQCFLTHCLLATTSTAQLHNSTTGPTQINVKRARDSGWGRVPSQCERLSAFQPNYQSGTHSQAAWATLRTNNYDGLTVVVVKQNLDLAMKHAVGKWRDWFFFIKCLLYNPTPLLFISLSLSLSLDKLQHIFGW